MREGIGTDQRPKIRPDITLGRTERNTRIWNRIL